MPLIEQTMTEKNLAAHQANAKQSHGAATPEGKERARAANLKHGYYSENRDQALVALGEDPAALAALAEGACRQFRPANAYQEWITGRIASLQWRIQRAERLQESKAASHIRTRERQRRESARERREQCAEVQGFLESVRGAAARPDFYAPNGCFELCGEIMEKNPGPNMDKILDLLIQLRHPARFSEPLPAALAGAMSDQDWHETLNNDAAGEYPAIDFEGAVAEGSDRDPLREKLWNLAALELRRVKEEWGKEIAAQEAPLSPRARDLLTLEINKELELTRREERSCVRELAQRTKELMKLQKESAETQKEGARDQRASSRVASADAPPRSGGLGCSVDPRSALGVSTFPVPTTPARQTPDGPSSPEEGSSAAGGSPPDSGGARSGSDGGGYGCAARQAARPEANLETPGVDLGATTRRSETAAPTPGATVGGVHENAGASGYVEENKSEPGSAETTKCPPAASPTPTKPRPEASPSHDSLTELRPGASAVPPTSLLPANGRGGNTANPRPEAA